MSAQTAGFDYQAMSSQTAALQAMYVQTTGMAMGMGMGYGYQPMSFQTAGMGMGYQSMPAQTAGMGMGYHQYQPMSVQQNTMYNGVAYESQIPDSDAIRLDTNSML
jgi:hypothetical protein